MEKAEKAKDGPLTMKPRALLTQPESTFKRALRALVLTVITFLVIGALDPAAMGRIYNGMKPLWSGETFEWPSDLNKAFEWAQLSPSPTLHWVKCYPEFQCARLEVPLNYEKPDGAKAAIALLRYPAKVKRDSSEYRGPVLFNPGGPGGSGVGLVTVYGPHFQRILGEEYDIIGFDPRGIGHTTPVVDVFETPMDRIAWYLRAAEAPLINETSSAIVEIAARSKIINALIPGRSAAGAENANTAVVCRDMLTITQAHGFDKLQYWGFSYGSVLGASFAALFPDNVGRLVIDGVVDATNYYAGLWDNNLRVADQGLDLIFKQCAEAGKENCALHASTGAKVKERFTKILDSLDEKPIIVHENDALLVITRRIVRSILFLVLYRPYRTAKPFFEVVHALERGNGLPLYLMAVNPNISWKCDCKNETPDRIGGEESGDAVMCGDAGPVSWDVDEFQQHFERLAASSYFGDIWSSIRLRCVGWKVKPNNPWSGPVAGNTSYPMLLVGNTMDPVTPDAEKMSHQFPGSVVLTQESAGHCSLAAVSLCTAKAIRAYFRDGALPSKGTVCEVEDHMFLDVTTRNLSALSAEDGRIVESVRAIQDTIDFRHPWRSS